MCVLFVCSCVHVQCVCLCVGLFLSLQVINLISYVMHVTFDANSTDLVPVHVVQSADAIHVIVPIDILSLPYIGHSFALIIILIATLTS